MRLLRSLEAVEPHSLKGVIKFLFFFQVLFEEQTEISFEVPYCKRNGEKMKKIICKLEEYVNVIYKELVHAKNSLLETKRNSVVRRNEHCSLRKTSEVEDNLLVNPDYNITWKIITKAQIQTFKRKLLEAFYIRKFEPTFNSQKDIRITHLFGNGIT